MSTNLLFLKSGAVSTRFVTLDGVGRLIFFISSKQLQDEQQFVAFVDWYYILLYIVYTSRPGHDFVILTLESFIELKFRE